MGFFGNLFDSFSSRFDSSVEWFCDGCNGTLNNQQGFTTEDSIWECEVCGHYNDVTDSNVYESHEDYRAKMGIPDCPSCGNTVTGDSPDATYYFNCGGCGRRWCLEDGELMSPFDERRFPSRRRCGSCQEELRGVFTAAWEDGDNSSSYVECLSCGHTNYLNID